MRSASTDGFYAYSFHSFLDPQRSLTLALIQTASAEEFVRRMGNNGTQRCLIFDSFLMFFLFHFFCVGFCFQAVYFQCSILPQLAHAIALILCFLLLWFPVFECVFVVPFCSFFSSQFVIFMHFLSLFCPDSIFDGVPIFVVSCFACLFFLSLCWRLSQQACTASAPLFILSSAYEFVLFSAVQGCFLSPCLSVPSVFLYSFISFFLCFVSFFIYVLPSNCTFVSILG